MLLCALVFHPEFTQVKPDGRLGLGVRHVQVLMLATCLAIAFSMRINMSLAIVAMTSTGEAFDWSIQKQSVILSSFFWGYIVLQIPASELAARYGGKILLLLCMAVNALVSFVTPFCAYNGGWQLVCACRAIQGLAQGFVFPSTYNMMGKWIPKDEKGRLGSFIFAGCAIGMALQNLCAGFIAEQWGWPAIFYVNGILTSAWAAIYLYVGAASPQSSTMISEEERFYIQDSLGQVGVPQKLKTPWKAILSSIPFLALMIVHGGNNWGFFTLMTQIPSYMANVLGVNIKKNGVLSSLPYIGAYLVGFPVGLIADYILKRKLLSVTATRKLFNSIGLYGAAVVLVFLSYIPATNMTVAVILLVMAVAVNAGHYAGFILVHIDMSPNFSGTLMGITNFYANIISIIAPLVAGALIQDETDPLEWRKVFFVSAAIYVLSNTIFIMFGSSEIQEWNKIPEPPRQTIIQLLLNR